MFSVGYAVDIKEPFFGSIIFALEIMGTAFLTVEMGNFLFENGAADIWIMAPISFRRRTTTAALHGFNSDKCHGSLLVTWR